MAFWQQSLYIRGSSNGKTAAFEAVYHGSNPCPRAKNISNLIGQQL